MNILSAAVAEAWERAVPFQEEDARFAAANDSVVLGHATGLGKTFISILAWSMWQGANKGLILGTLGSIASWMRILKRWGGVDTTFMQGSDPNWKHFLQAKQGVYACTYQTYLHNMKQLAKGKPHVDVLVNDELHKVMRHRNQTWKAIKRLDFDHYLGLSATWASRGPQDLYPVLNLVNHRTFSSYWRWVQTWCYVENTEGFGTQVWGVRNEENLRKLLWSRYFRSRRWSEVGNQFRKGDNVSEPVIRRLEKVPMGAQQTRLIRDLDRDMMVMLNGEMVVTPNSLALLTRKLQMAISPKILLPSAEWGFPVEWIAEKVSEDPHVVIFCPFREGLEVMKAKLVEDGYPANRIFFFQGGMKPDEVNRQVDLWKVNKGVALGTIAFAQSFPLDTTDNCYMLGFDWDPNNNIQAEGRLRRLDSILQTPCNVTYVCPEMSDYDFVVLDVLANKTISTRGYLTGKIDPNSLPLFDSDKGEEDDDSER